MEKISWVLRSFRHENFRKSNVQTVAVRKRKKILLIDDDLLFQRFISLQLGLLNEVKCVSSLTSAREALAKFEADIVLIDINLGHESGLTLLDAIGARSARPLIIVISGEDSLSVVLSALQSGADDYVVKTENLSQDLQIRIAVIENRRGKSTNGVRNVVVKKFSPSSYKQYLEMHEREYLVEALNAHSRNVTETAKKIGVSRATLLNRINELGIDR